jgi:hypothetical protein
MVRLGEVIAVILIFLVVVLLLLPGCATVAQGCESELRARVSCEKTSARPLVTRAALATAGPKERGSARLLRQWV